MTSLTRGPLPPRVYWRRRLMVLGTALALVVAIANLLGGGSDGSEPDRAAPVAAAPTGTPGETSLGPSGPASPGAPGATPAGQGTGKGKGRRPSQVVSTAPVLAEPEGRCDSTDVSVTPEVSDAIAGRDVEVLLHLRTTESDACTWRVSPGNVTVKITSGPDDIWSSRECPRTLPTEDVVVRNNVTTTVGLSWNARRSDEDCSPRTEWALPGFYYVAAASLGGEPSDVQFELDTPVGVTITRTAEPSPAPDEKDRDGKDEKKKDRRKNRD